MTKSVFLRPILVIEAIIALLALTPHAMAQTCNPNDNQVPGSIQVADGSTTLDPSTAAVTYNLVGHETCSSPYCYTAHPGWGAVTVSIPLAGTYDFSGTGSIYLQTPFSG